MSKRLSQCICCKHLRERGQNYTCEAFPDGVPKAIRENRFVHDAAYPGDGGIRWEEASPELGELWEMGTRMFENSHPDYKRGMGWVPGAVERDDE